MPTRFSQQGQTLIWQRDGETVWIQPWGADSVRVRATRSAEMRETDWALLPPAAVEVDIELRDEEASLRNGLLLVTIAHTGWIRFFNAETGAVLLEERPHLRVRDFVPLDGARYRIEARFNAYDGERLYGLGQHQHGLLDQKGCVIELMQENTEVTIPFLVSGRGYGFLWHNPAVGRVELARNQTRWVANRAAQLDYWVTAGNAPAEILRHYAQATGFSPDMPDWATGFWQCKLRYSTQEELLSVAREYHRRKLPLSVIVIDYFHWTMMGDWKFDPTCWPDPQAMVDELRVMGIELMVSIWPTVNLNSENYAAMEERGYLLHNERGLPVQMNFVDSYPEGRVCVRYYDPFHPGARQFIWERVRANYYRYGIKVWWLDACEPEMMPAHHDNVHYYLGNGEEVGNLYPRLHEQAFYDGMRAEGETDILTLCRSAWAGSQRYGAAVWSGDIASTFDSLRRQVRAGLNMAMSGIPWWTTDIGGFHGGDVESPDFRELLVRWFQYAVFCPLCRLHGVRLPGGDKSGGPNELWSFGEEAYAILTEQLALRERLRPYLAVQMHCAHTTGLPPMRPLFVDFPADPIAAEIDDQFMLGPDLLVAPILDADARARAVYLPAGTCWVDTHTGVALAGGQCVTVDAPLAAIPVFVRESGWEELSVVFGQNGSDR